MKQHSYFLVIFQVACVGTMLLCNTMCSDDAGEPDTDDQDFLSEDDQVMDTEFSSDQDSTIDFPDDEPSGTDDDDGTERSCSSTSINDCRSGELCFNAGGPYCDEFLGHCAAIPISCNDETWLDWRACLCGGQDFETACAALLEGNGDRLFLCANEPEAAVQCTVADTDACDQDSVCVADTCNYSTGCTGFCMTLEAACASSPAARVCESADSSNLGPLSNCWESPCEAWTSGYRGPLAIAE
jgi:hypothetical protein